MTRLSLLLLCIAAGCSPLAVPRGKVPAVVVLSQNIGYGGEPWRQAFIREHHQNCRAFVVHGSDRGGDWYLSSDDPDLRLPWRGVAKLLHAIEPETNWLLVSCNEAHETLHVPKVWFAPRTIWTEPGAEVRMSWLLRLESATGDIREFREGK